MLKSTQISRKLTCWSLNLPLELVCSKCRPGMEKIMLGRKTSMKFKSCLQHWGARKYSSHWEQWFLCYTKERCSILGKLSLKVVSWLTRTCTDNNQQNKKKTSRPCPSIFKPHHKPQLKCQPYHLRLQYQQAQHHHPQPSRPKAKILWRKNV